MTEPTLRDCINYMKQQLKGMEKYPKSYEFNIPYYRKTIECLEAGRPHGEWIFKNGKYRCSVCLEPCATFCMNEPRDRFCLWCGSDNGKKGEAE